MISVKKDEALLIIDVQNAMFSSLNGTSVYNCDAVLDKICLLLEKARLSETPVVFIQHTDNTDEEYAEGKPTWHIHPKIAPLANEKVVRKGTWDSFHKTTLHEELQNLGIKKLTIIGMQSEFCVDTTCRRAFSMGYENVLVSDAHSTFDTPVLTAAQIIQHHNRVLGGRFVQLKATNEIEF